jgi:two-component system nitrate/nitrite response regulator NarL
MSSDLRVFNADDHPILRKGVSDLLIGTAGIKWVGSASNGEEALASIRSIQPEVAILDIEMPFLSGIDVAKTLLKEGSKTKFIILTLYKDETLFHEAMELGIRGYLLKESSEKEIVDCVITVGTGMPYVHPIMSRFLLARRTSKHELLEHLTDHEINILKLISRQMTSTQIAEMLFISQSTVGNHRSNISKKLDLGGEQNGLLKWAIENKSLLNSA